MSIRPSLAVLALCVLTMGAHGQEHVFRANGISIEHPWARAAAAGGETLVFMDIDNEGAADTLTGGISDAAGDVHIVGITLSNGETGVQEVGAIAVPAGHFHLDPGGLALELHGLTRELKQGEHFDLTVTFANAGPIAIEVEVQAADAKQHSHAGHSH